MNPLTKNQQVSYTFTAGDAKQPPAPFEDVEVSPLPETEPLQTPIEQQTATAAKAAAKMPPDNSKLPVNAPSMSSAAVAQSTANVAATSLQRFTPLQLSDIERVISVFKLFNPDLSREAINSLSVKNFSLLCQNLCILISLKKQPKIACEALTRFFIEASPENFIEKFFVFLKECQLPPPLLNTLQNATLAGARLDSTSQSNTFLGESSNLHQKEMVKTTFNIIQELMILLEPIWKKAVLDSNEAVFENQLCIAVLPKIKKEVRKKNSKKEITFGSSEACYSQISQLTPRLMFYIVHYLPDIKNQITRLTVDSPGFAYTIAKIKTALEKCFQHIKQITEQLNAELGRYEANLSLTTGFPARSFAAKKMEKRLYQQDVEIRNGCCRLLRHVFDKILKADKYKAALSQKISQKSDKNFTDRFCKLFSVEPSNHLKKQKHQALEFENELFKECADTITKISPFLRNLYQDFFKSEEAGYTPIKCLFEILKSAFTIPPGPAKSWRDRLTQFQTAFQIAASEFNENYSLTLLENQLFAAAKTCDERAKKVSYDKEGSEKEILIASQFIDRNLTVYQSSFFFQTLFQICAENQDKINEALFKEQTVLADSCLHILELEEETAAAKKAAEDAEHAKLERESAAAKKAYADAERAQNEKQKDAKLTKESDAKSSVAPVSAPITQTNVEIPKRVNSPFNTPSSQLLFNLRNELAEWHGMTPSTVTPPASVMGTFISISDSAKLQQLYANDGLAASLEMLSACQDAQEKIVLTQLVLQWGYLALEQSLTTEYAKVHPQEFLQHNLTVLLRGLGINHSSLWTEHAASNTLYHRYPWYFKAKGNKPLPFALKHLQKGNEFSTKEFCTKLSTWIEGAASLQIAILSHANNKHPNLKRIQEAVELFRKDAANTKEASEKETKNLLSTKNEELLSASKRKLNIAMALLQKHLTHLSTQSPSSPEMIKALKNAGHHLSNLKIALSLLLHFPQQRFMHVIFQLLHASVKDFAENLGVVLSMQQNSEWYTHSLATYSKEYGLGAELSKELCATLSLIDVAKGNEYPYKYFSSTSEQAVSPLMAALSDFYARSKEATLMGEGAVPSSLKPMDVPALQDSLVGWATRFAALACGCAESHLKQISKDK